MPPINNITIMTKWTENSFRSNFNPGTTVGQRIFIEKTKGLSDEKHVELTMTNSKHIMEYFCAKEGHMGATITSVPTTFVGSTA